MNSPAQILSALNLVKEVTSPEGSLRIIDDITFNISASETIAIVGASGSGKSTLLGLLAGLDVPSSGRVLLDGTDLNQLDEDGRAALRSRMVGFVFQSFQLLPTLTAIENTMLPLELAGSPHAAPVAHELLARVGLEARKDHKPNQLSGGEQQRVAIARAFAAQPRILFADEPTGNLDQHTGARIIELLFNLNREQHTTLVLVTHDERLASHCERRLHLEMGRLVEMA